MFIVTQTGGRYQTKPMPTARAFRFAKMIVANGQYEEVEVHHVGGRQYRVVYRAKDEARQQKLLARQQEAREKRAATCDPGKYSATAHSCSCPDWQNRGQYVGMACKHQLAVRQHELEMAQARREKVAAELREIFGEDGFGGG